MSNNNQTKPATNDNEFKIYLETPEKFPCTLNSCLTTSNKVCQLVNALFRAAFTDYEGCFLQMNRDGNLGLRLYFKDKGEASDGMIKTLMPRGTTDKNSPLFDRLQAFNAAHNSRKIYTISDATKKALDPFFDIRNVDWNQVVTEESINVNQYNQQYTVIVCVSEISLSRVLSTIYGRKDENKEELQYQAFYVRPAAAGSTNSIIQIMQLNKDNLEMFANEIGVFMANPMQTPIVTA